MDLELNGVKRLLQDHLQEGLLLVVGTGLSMAEGIPGMGSLAEHLKHVVPKELPTPDSGWDGVVAALDGGDHLEAAMAKTQLQALTIDTIVEATALFISANEKQVFERVLSGQRVLPFTIFIKHLFKAGKKFHLITPNYDRLIELATEMAEIGVDSRFFGYLHGRLDSKRSADVHRESYVTGKNSSFRALPCLCVHKPHGSLDWFEIGGRVVRCPINVGKKPVIISPGTSKYQKSFEAVFDDQRTSGNRSASNASRFMFIGYGFNDDHLEQFLCPNSRLAKPSVILAKELSRNARRVIENSNGLDVIALCAISKTDLRTKILSSRGEELIVDEQLWHLDGFNKGVL